MRILCLLLFFLPDVTFSQEPCRTFPMKGYSGTCSLSMLMTEDGKFVYTSDRVNLKKWDIGRMIVVEEIPFSHRLVATTPDPDVIVIEEGRHYSFRRRTLTDEKAEFLASLDAEDKAALEKAKKQHYSLIYDPNDRFIFFHTDGRMMQYNLTTNKISMLFEYSVYEYDQSLNTFFFLELKTKEFSYFNVSTGQKVQTKKTGIFGSLQLAPGGRYYMLTDRNSLKFLDKAYSVVATMPYAGHIKWNPDSTSFIVYDAEYYNNLFYYTRGFVEQYAYPELKLISMLSQPWYDDQYRYLYYFVDAAKSSVYVQQGSHARRDEKPVLMKYDIATSALQDSLTFRYTLSMEESNVAEIEREQRRRIGNRAIESLYNMATPESFHSITSIAQVVDDFTPDGKILIREEYHGSTAACILWSFPEGKPINLYYDRNCGKSTGVGKNSVAVPTYGIYKSHLSPSGKFVGLSTKDGAMVYEGSTLKFTLPEKDVIALTNKYALVSGIKSDDLEVADINSGQILYKINNGRPSFSKIEKYHSPGKIFFYNEYGVNVFDENAPSSMQTYSKDRVKQSGFGDFYFDGSVRSNYETGVKELVPGYRAPEFLAGNAVAQYQHNYILYSDAVEGLKVMDARTAKLVTPKPLYSGWTAIKDMVYLKDLNKILILNRRPIYTSPNATPEDPAASAYTFDISSGEVIPYLLTDSRAAMLANAKEREARMAAWEYAAKSDCKHGLKFKDGMTVSSGDNVLIILGYDCDEKVYIVSTRELYQEPGGGTYRQRVRIEKRSPLQLSGYESMGNVWQICTNCGGQPERTHISTFTGWTEWEQQNFNIYTRKFVTNKRVEERTHCKLCEGGWQKR